VAKKNVKARGQAFIVFDEIESAQNAIEELQGFDLSGKEMKLDYAKSRSDAIVQAEGTEEELETHKRARKAEKGTAHSQSALGGLNTDDGYRTQASP